MKNKLFPLLILPLLLMGCNTSGGEVDPGTGTEGEPSGDPTPGGESEPELTKVTLFSDLAEAGFNAEDNLSQESVDQKMDDYIEAKMPGLFNSFITSNSYIQDDGKHNTYLTIGSNKYEGEMYISFHQPVYKVVLSLSCWSNYYYYAWHAMPSAAKVAFGHSETVFVLNADENEEALVVTKELKGTAVQQFMNDNKELQINKFVSGSNNNNRIVVRKMEVYFKNAN